MSLKEKIPVAMATDSGLADAYYMQGLALTNPFGGKYV